jgi:hypothetical protein
MERLNLRRLIPLSFTSLFLFSLAMLIGLLIQPINFGLVRYAACAFVLLSLISGAAAGSSA